MATMGQIAALKKFSTCDISDGLLKMGMVHGGFLPDLQLRTAPKQHAPYPLVGRAWTVSFVEKSKPNVIPNFSGHYIDQIPVPDNVDDPTEHWPTIPVLSAPDHLQCAVFGGIMALRASVRNALAVVVCGRVRDIGEMNSTACTTPIFSRGTSTVGAGASSKVATIGTQCEVTGYGMVCTGDVVVIDENGTVIIPSSVDLDAFGKVLEKLISQDDQVKESVMAGMSVEEAFTKWRT